MTNLFVLTAIFLIIALIYRFRLPVLDGLRRFDARNVARRAEEMRARFDKYAHYRQTIELAEEQIEPVSRIVVADVRTGEPVTRYLFQAVEYASLADAEAVRHIAVIAKAREFYVDLDRIYLARRGGRREPTVETPSLPHPVRPDKS